jgi:hypothetical protein
MDTRLLSLTSRELVAAEAQYHISRYKICTKEKKDHKDEKEDQDEAYTSVESSAYDRLWLHQEGHFHSTPCGRYGRVDWPIIYFMNTLGVTMVKSHTKKHITSVGGWRQNLVKVHIFPGDKGKLLVATDNLTVQMLAAEYMKVKDELEKKSNAF